MRELTDVIGAALAADEGALAGRVDVDVLLDTVRSRAARRRRRRYAVELASVAAVAAVALVVGVSAGSSPAPAPPAPPVQSVTPSPVPTSTSSLPPSSQAPERTTPTREFTDGAGAAIPVVAVDLSRAAAAVQGRDYTVDDVTTPEFGKGGYVAPTLLLDDGTWFATRTPADNYHPDTEGIAHPSNVGIWDGTTFHAWDSTADLVPGDAPRQLWDSAASDRWVVWVESSSIQAGIGDWRMFAARRDGGDVHLVARSDEDGSYGGYSPAVVGDRVYWTTDADRVVSKDVSGTGEIRLEGSGIGRPVAVDGGLVVETIDAPSADEEVHGLALLTSDGVEPFLRIAKPGERVRSIAAAGRTVVFAIAPNAYSYDLDTGRLVEMITPAGGMEAWSTAAGDGFISWSTGLRDDTLTSDVYLLNAGDPMPSRIDLDREQAEVSAAGGYLGWRLGNGNSSWTTARPAS